MIRTERLHIIPLSYYELLSRVYSYSGMISCQEEEDNVVKYSLTPMKDAPEKDRMFYTVWVGYSEGEDVMECGFLCPPTEHNVVEVWYWVREQFRGKGFATESVKGLVKFATAFDNIKHVCASVDNGNFASKKVLIKNGFKYLTDMKHMEVYNKQLKN